MRPHLSLKYKFVTTIPDKLEELTLYISIEYATTVHKCCCGCGNEVATPLSPADWKLTYDGVSVSLFPSIGNWGFNCKSHYWIERSKAKWAGQFSNEEIEAVRNRDRRLIQRYYGEGDSDPKQTKVSDVDQQKKQGLLNRFWEWL